MSLLNRVLSGERRAASRLMRMVDDRVPGTDEIMEALYEHRCGASYIGVTGSPGAGKSTLVNQLIVHFRKEGKRVGVIAVDPTSPFSGGAILGDRVRMGQHANDDDVYIRSVATRGNLGGISRSTPALMIILDATGFDIVIIETVGVGQSEVDVAAFCDVNIVLAVPGMGDEVQAAKAGLFEVADLFVVNKSDRPGTDRLVRELKQMIGLGHTDQLVFRCQANLALGENGVPELYAQIVKGIENAKKNLAPQDRQRRRAEAMIRMLASAEFGDAIGEFLKTQDDLSSPYKIVKAFFQSRR